MPGKIRDYSPHIRPAGLQCASTGTVHRCLKIHNVEDAIETVMHEGGLKRVQPELKRQRMTDWRHRGVFQESRECMAPPVKTRYQTLLNDLRETALGSYWSAEIGKSRDPIGAFPAGMDVADRTFGKPTKSDVHMKELVNPPKSTFEILYETNEYHPIYRKSHNNYYPGEKINRNYLQPPYIPNRKYGKARHYDNSGPCSKILFKDKIGEPVMSSNKIQADFKQRTQFQVGKCLTPNNNISCVPKHLSFGKKTYRALCGVEELLKPNEVPNTKKKEFYIWLSHLNQLRNHYKKNSVDFEDIKSLCLFYDDDHTGWITQDVFFKILTHTKVYFNRTFILPLAEEFGYVRENLVKYKEFLNMLQMNYELPNVPKLTADFNSDQHYLTSSRLANMDYLLCDNSKCAAAGLPTVICRGTNVDLREKWLESSAAIALNPSLYTNYSLSHLDFWEPRSPEYLKSLFEAAGYEFPDDKFEKLLDLARKVDNSNEVCVDTFKHVLREANSREKNNTT